MNLLGAAMYGVVTVLALLALGAARSQSRPAREFHHWLGVAGFFLFLAGARVFEMEEGLRTALRTYSQVHGLYGERGSFQLVLVVIIIALLAAAILFAWRFWPRRPLSMRQISVLLARGAVLGYLPLIALRIVSLHATDRILYTSPVHMNWLIDGGLVLMASCSAVIYLRQGRG